MGVRKFFLEFKSLISPQKINDFYKVFLLLILNSLIEIFSILSLSYFFGILAGSTKLINSSLNLIGESYQPYLVTYSGLISLSIFILRITIFISLENTRSKFIWENRSWLRERLLKNYFRKNILFIRNQNSERLIQTLIGESEFLAARFFMPFFELIGSLLTVILIASTLIYFAPDVAITILILSTLFAFVSLKFVGKKFKGLGRKRMIVDGICSQYASEVICGHREISVSGSEDYFIGRFLRASSESSKLIIQINKANRLPGPILELFMVTVVIGLVLLAYAYGDQFSDYFPTLLLFSISSYRLLPSVKGLTQSIGQLQQSLPIYRFYIDELKSNQSYSFINSVNFSFNKAIELKKVCLKLSDREEFILNNINIRIQPNEYIAFIGKSGSGKTSLINLIMGLIAPSSGSISIDGVELRGENMSSWHENIGLVPQDVYLIDDTIAANIALGITHENRNYSRIREVARMAQIDNFIENLSNTYETSVGERGSLLSGGQRQRIGLARALYKMPKVLILDEATSNLDPETERKFLKVIDGLKEGITIMVISHSDSAIKNCKRFIYINNGEIVEDKSL